MANPSTVTAIRWQEIAPWLILVRAARVALLFRVIALALIGVLLTQLGWSLAETTFFGNEGSLRKVLTSQELAREFKARSEMRLTRLEETSRDFEPNELLEVENRLGHVPRAVGHVPRAEQLGGPLLRGWTWAIQPFSHLSYVSGWRGWFYLLTTGTWTLAIWALFGGAIARIAAIHLTYGETIGPLTALRESAAKWPSTVGAPLLCFAAVAIIAIPLALAGFLLHASVFAFLIGLGWFIVLLFGIALAIVLVGLAFGWPLMWSTIAVERSDAFDAVSRAYAYVFQRPLHAVFYLLVAGVLGLLAQTGVNLMVDATLAATDWAVEIGAGGDRLRELHHPQNVSALDRTGVKAIQFWTTGFRGIADAFCMAYLWPAAVAIYLLLRRHIDATDLGDVVFDEGPPTRGLPPLATDPATGVPRVDPAATAQPPAS